MSVSLLTFVIGGAAPSTRFEFTRRMLTHALAVCNQTDQVTICTSEVGEQPASRFTAWIDAGACLPVSDMARLLALLQEDPAADYSLMVLGRRYMPAELLDSAASPADIQQWMARSGANAPLERLKSGLGSPAGLKITAGVQQPGPDAVLLTPWMDLGGLGLRLFCIEPQAAHAETLPVPVDRASRFAGLSASHISAELASPVIRDGIDQTLQRLSARSAVARPLVKETRYFYKRLSAMLTPEYWDATAAVYWVARRCLPLTCLITSASNGVPAILTAAACRAAQITLVDAWMTGQAPGPFSPADLSETLDACGLYGALRIYDSSATLFIQPDEQVDMIVIGEENDLPDTLASLETLCPRLAPGGALVFSHANAPVFEAAWQTLRSAHPEWAFLRCGASGLALNTPLENHTVHDTPVAERAQQQLEMAYQHFAQGAVDTAETCLESALMWIPGLLEARKSLAHLYLQTGRYEKAVRAFLDVLDDNPQDIDTLLMMAGMYLQAGEPEQAARYAQSAYAIDPENETVQQLLTALLPSV
ncbi:MAG: tetratricopeptide repeat protein, partial [Anaerolineae bacterium]|nr:tetratricopeptide repeat protein [Anaerolineae bacterium]